jgi:hypothetical protein
MAKDFNVYQWRREHLNENKYDKNKVESFLNEINSRISDFTPNEKLIVMEQLLKHHKSKLNENEEVRKTVGELTWDDVSGLSLPTSDSGTYMYMDNSDRFDDQWREKTLKYWKDSLVKHFPEALSFEVVIDGSQPSYNQVKILDKNYIDTMQQRSDARMADYKQSGRTGYMGAKYKGD